MFALSLRGCTLHQKQVLWSYFSIDILPATGYNEYIVNGAWTIENTVITTPDNGIILQYIPTIFFFCRMFLSNTCCLLNWFIFHLSSTELLKVVNPPVWLFLHGCHYWLIRPQRRTILTFFMNLRKAMADTYLTPLPSEILLQICMVNISIRIFLLSF